MGFKGYASVLLASKESLYTNKKIEEGLIIQHGFSTIIMAESIGKNFWVNQQATVGYDAKGCPTIGNNVVVASGAKVIGEIVVGNNEKLVRTR